MEAAAGVKQDLPPTGGYSPICYKRVPAKTFFNGWALIGGYLAMTAGAGYLFHLNTKKIHKEDVEMRSARNAVLPLLLAERDREYLKQLRKNRDEEAELMKNVEGWEVGTWYGEPIYRSVPKDQMNDPTMHGFYVHSDFKDFKRRAHFQYWT